MADERMKRWKGSASQSGGKKQVVYLRQAL
jgi:hypothetical protein